MNSLALDLALARAEREAARWCEARAAGPVEDDAALQAALQAVRREERRDRRRRKREARGSASGSGPGTLAA